MPPRIAANLREGYVLDGKYRIEKVLGVGGMGVVAAAHHLELGTRVAVKLLLAGEMDAAEAVERFSREARAASGLRGEHAVRVFDVGRAPDGTPYMVMEYLVGKDLDALLVDGGPLESDVAVDYVLQACEALAEAHGLGIIHRDLKPRNLFLAERVDGSAIVKVLDFGIAKRVEAGGAALTRTLSVVGSPHYMSPEQMRAARDVDIRSDIWSLGVCLYELLTGAMPFEGETALAICAAAMRDEPKRPDELRPELPRALGEVVMTCLRKEPGERFQDVAALTQALEPFGPTSARGTSARVAQVLGSAAGRETPASRRGPPSPLGVSTEVRPARGALGGTAGRALLAAAAGVAVVAGLAVGFRAMTTPSARVAASAPPPQAPGPATQTPSSAPPEVVSAPTVSVLDLPPASASTPGPAGRGAPPRRAPDVSGLAPSATSPRTSDRAATGATPPPSPGSAPPGQSKGPEDTAVAAAAPAAVAATALPAPAYSLETARAQVGTPAGVVGTTASNVSRALSGLGSRATACYRDALPRMSGALDGTSTLHLETDEEGHIVDARLVGPLAALGPCVVAAVRGRQVPNADTGRVRADVPLVFSSR